MCVENLIYADRPSLDLLCDALPFHVIARPDTRRQAKLGIVRETDRLFFGLECRDGKRRSESLFLHRPHVICRA